MLTLYAVLVVGGALLANLLIAAMFLLRVHRPERAHGVGMAGTSMAVPLAAASVVGFIDGRAAWDVALPLVFVAFAAVEVLVDVVLDVEVRESRWLWAYLTLFYLGQWALIGAAFRISDSGGFVVLVSYFVCLAATVYSYRRVGHGSAVGTDEQVTSRGGASPART